MAQNIRKIVVSVHYMKKKRTFEVDEGSTVAVMWSTANTARRKLNIRSGAKARIDGREVDYSDVVEHGDVVVFE